MKIKKAFGICKKNKVISIFGNEKGEQWLSDDYAVYPIFGLPTLNEDYICKLYDINDAQRDKIRFTISQTKPLIDVEDCSADETPAEMWDISIIYDGKVMLPISTAEGLMFIDRVYLNPFVDLLFKFYKSTEETRASEIFKELDADNIRTVACHVPVKSDNCQGIAKSYKEYFGI